MEEKKNFYVNLDGMLLNKEHLVKLAFNVGSFSLAEHYLNALLFYGLLHNQRDILSIVNEVRRSYRVPEIPLNGIEIFEKPVPYYDKLDDEARKIFSKMGEAERYDIIRDALNLMYEQYHIFFLSKHWLSVFLVLRDRLYGENFKMNSLLGLSDDITPLNWPASLQMDMNTYKNLSRVLNDTDKDLAYYEMELNPQQQLCNKLWTVLKELLLAAGKKASPVIA